MFARINWLFSWLHDTIGLLLSRMMGLFNSDFQNDPAKILMIGLDAAGKTTILYKIKLNEVVTTILKLGMLVETVTPVKGVTFTVWDMEGQDKARPLWRHYFQNTLGVLYVVDSADRERLGEAREELMNVLNSDEMRGVPVVVLANKQDLPGAASVSEVAEKLGVSGLGNRKWHIQATSAVSGDGVYEGLREMSRLVKEFKRSWGY